MMMTLKSYKFVDKIQGNSRIEAYNGASMLDGTQGHPEEPNSLAKI